MEPITLERYLNDPELRLRLDRNARRARSLAVHRLLRMLVARLTPRPRPIHWIARLG